MSRSAASAPFGRIVTAMVTPMQPDGSLDLAGARTLARHLLAHGSEGLVLAGTTGESPTLSDAEKLALFEAVVDEVGGDASIVANTGTYDTAHSVHLTREAARVGVDAVLAVTPYYSKPPPEGILRHFAAIAEASGGCPVIAYNIPQRCVVNLSPELLTRIAQEVPLVTSVKQATTDPVQARALVEAGLVLYAGNDDLLLPFLELGGVGGICVASHVIGREFLRLCELHAAGDVAEARALDADLAPMLHALAVTTNPIPVKAAVAMLGLPAGPVRLPLVDADETERDVVRVALERRGLLLRA